MPGHCHKHDQNDPSPLGKLRRWTWCIFRWEMHLRRSCIICNPNPSQLRTVSQEEHTCPTSWIYSPPSACGEHTIGTDLQPCHLKVFHFFSSLLSYMIIPAKWKGPALTELLIFSSQALWFPRIPSALSLASQWLPRCVTASNFYNVLMSGSMFFN